MVIGAYGLVNDLPYLLVLIPLLYFTLRLGGWAERATDAVADWILHHWKNRDIHDEDGKTR